MIHIKPITELIDAAGAYAISTAAALICVVIVMDASLSDQYRICFRAYCFYSLIYSYNAN